MVRVIGLGSGYLAVDGRGVDLGTAFLVLQEEGEVIRLRLRLRLSYLGLVQKVV